MGPRRASKLASEDFCTTGEERGLLWDFLFVFWVFFPKKLRLKQKQRQSLKFWSGGGEGAGGPVLIFQGSGRARQAGALVKHSCHSYVLKIVGSLRRGRKKPWAPAVSGLSDWVHFSSMSTLPDSSF